MLRRNERGLAPVLFRRSNARSTPRIRTCLLKYGSTSAKLFCHFPLAAGLLAFALKASL
jgi:hypothetical protein